MSISLIESKRTSKKSVRSAVVSVALHASVITLAVYASANAAQPIVSAPADTVRIVFPKPTGDRAPSTQSRQRPESSAPSASNTYSRRAIAIPIAIPTSLPIVPATDSIGDDGGLFGTPGVPSGAGAGGHAATGADGAFDVHQVDKPALSRAGNPFPRYPAFLESSRVEGDVLAQFVVDTLGLAEMSTFKILESSNDLFSESLRAALPSWRFFPAESGGHKVRQIVQLPLKFIAPNH